MRWSASLSLFLLSRAQEAIATSWSDSPDLPTVYLYDPESPSIQSDAKLDIVDAHIASLIFAHRLEVADHFSIGDVADVALQHLNKYTTLSKTPSTVESPGKHLFVVVNDAQPANDQSSVPGLVTFRLSASPTIEDDTELAGKFASYIEKTHSAHKRSTELIFDHGGSVDGIIKKAIEDRVALTLVVNSNPATSSSPGSHIYGDLPRATEKLLNRRQEAPLLEPISAMDDVPPTTPSSPHNFAANATKFPLTAQCYDSVDSCNSETNSCSGHGECILARKGPAKEDEDVAECYQCKCGKEERKNDDGSIKTTYYGGSACQKKDISAPFWILTLTAGSLFALVGFGVSMLYAMGNAELPSVIGAGVSGPKAK